MRAAPAVSVGCSRAGAWRGLLALMPALAVAALVAWVLGHLQRPVWPALLVVLPVTALAWWQIRTGAVTLAWDGQRWSADGEPGALDLMLDLGPWMLLRLRPAEPARRTIWIPVSAADAGSAWHALRAAVYSRVPTSTAAVRPAEHVGVAKAD